ncbi:amidohydrolase [Paracoccus sanguinis]|uniref:amidohydrolase n=1 Tax=Paracoccus sanguinis TaxID=1545044 RepID=UPI00051F9E73|nr:amidohydrolase [Paracoccus sanguinis]KGJ19275.1 amidohydrolase [Paracoccus sanguinis]
MAAVAELVLRGGTVWRGKGAPPATALASFAGRVLATGTDAEIAPLIGPSTRVVELDGRFAMPGLNDDHLHLISTGLALADVDASPQAAPTLDALLEAIRARAAVTPKGAWILARGYEQQKLDIGRHPHRTELDAVAPDHPVMLTRACGHVSVANSRALALGGVTAGTEAPAGGVIGTANGTLTGLLAENAQNLVGDHVPVPSEETLVAAIEAAGRQLLSQGITSCMDAAVGMVAGMAEIRAYQRALREGRLPVRVSLTLLGDPGSSIVTDCHAAGLVTGAGCDRLRVGAVKIFLDGSLGGRTAWMETPYKDEPENFGVRMLEDAQLEALVRDYHAMGYQMACHAIGTGAIGQLVTAYEAALAAHPDPNRRHRVEHCGFPSRDQLARMRAAGIEPSPQQVFIHDFGDSYLAVRDDRAEVEAGYPLGTWLGMGFRPGTGSDSPVCRTDPLPNLHQMLTRRTCAGTLMDAREAVDAETALQVFTENGAFLSRDEAAKGRLDPGMLADIAIFSRDLTRATPEEILTDTVCEMTILGGQVTYDRSAG